MRVTCQISQRNTNYVYKAGDTVKGAVTYTIDKPTKFTSVTVSLTSKELCYWEPITETEIFVDQRMDLLHAGHSESVTLLPGTYEEQFCFVLPEEIPSSNKNFISFISFFIQVEFVKLNPINVPERFYSEVRVETGIKQANDEVECQGYEVKKEFNVLTPKKTVTLRAGILKPHVFAGEDIIVISDVYNLDKIPLVSIKTEIIEFVSYKSSGNNVKLKHEIIKGSEITFLGINRLQTKHTLIQYFSTTPEKFSIHTNMLRKEYGIKVTVSFPFPHEELFLVIPVVIAEKYDEHEKSSPMFKNLRHGKT